MAIRGKEPSPWLFARVVLFLVPSPLYVSLSHLVFGAGCGILLYGFLIIAFLSTLDVVMLLRKEFIYIILCAEIGFIIISFKVTVKLKTSR